MSAHMSQERTPQQCNALPHHVCLCISAQQGRPCQCNHPRVLFGLAGVCVGVCVCIPCAAGHRLHVLSWLCRCAFAFVPLFSRACRASPQTTASTLPQPPASPLHHPRPARGTAMETAGRPTTSHGCSGRPPPSGSTLLPPPRPWSVLSAVSHVGRALVPVCCSRSGARRWLLLPSWTAPMGLRFYVYFVGALLQQQSHLRVARAPVCCGVWCT